MSMNSRSNGAEVPVAAAGMAVAPRAAKLGDGPERGVPVEEGRPVAVGIGATVVAVSAAVGPAGATGTRVGVAGAEAAGVSVVVDLLAGAVAAGEQAPAPRSSPRPSAQVSVDCLTGLSF